MGNVYRSQILFVSLIAVKGWGSWQLWIGGYFKLYHRLKALTTFSDPGRYATGFSIPENGPVEAGESTAGFYVMPASEFKEGGTLVAWEFSAEVIGDVHLAVCMQSA